MNQRPQQPHIALPPDIAQQRQAEGQAANQVQNLMLQLSSSILVQLSTQIYIQKPIGWFEPRAEESQESFIARITKHCDHVAQLAAQQAQSMLVTLDIVARQPVEEETPAPKP